MFADFGCYVFFSDAPSYCLLLVVVFNVRVFILVAWEMYWQNLRSGHAFHIAILSGYGDKRSLGFALPDCTQCTQQFQHTLVLVIVIILQYSKLDKTI
jgi:hypothetical protein